MLLVITKFISMQKEYKTKEGQSLLDISIQLYGDHSYAFKLLQDNPTKIKCLDTVLLPGTTLVYEADETIVKSNLDQQDLVISTAYPQTQPMKSLSTAFNPTQFN